MCQAKFDCTTNPLNCVYRCVNGNPPDAAFVNGPIAANMLAFFSVVVISGTSNPSILRDADSVQDFMYFIREQTLALNSPNQVPVGAGTNVLDAFNWFVSVNTANSITNCVQMPSNTFLTANDPNI